MKKIISLLVLAMALMLVACGAKEAPVAEPPATENAHTAVTEKVEVTMIAAAYSSKTAAWWADFVTKFNTANEHIHLTVDVVSWNELYTRVSALIASGQAPDLLNADTFTDFVTDGLLLPAEAWVSEKTYAKFFPSFLDESAVDGVVWAIPDMASARAMYYNADILKAAGVAVPTTWEELRAACEAIKAYDPDVYPWGVDMTTDEGQACFSYYAWNNGGGFVDADGNWTLNSAENVEAVEFITGLVTAGLTNTAPTTETRYDLQDMFATGKVAMMIGPNQLSKYCEKNGSISYGIAPIPTNKGNAGASIGVMERIMCFDNGYSAEKLAAVTAVVDAFYDDKSYVDWILTEGFLPATTTGNELCAAADPNMAVWGNVIGSAKFYPAAKAEWANVKQGVIAVQQEVLQGSNAQELLDALQAEITG